jgi:hypothetical protein
MEMSGRAKQHKTRGTLQARRIAAQCSFGGLATSYTAKRYASLGLKFL